MGQHTEYIKISIRISIGPKSHTKPQEKLRISMHLKHRREDMFAEK